MTFHIFNTINKFYNNNRKIYSYHNLYKINLLKILLDFINEKNDDEIKILFNKYILKFKSNKIKLDSINNMQHFLVRIKYSTDIKSFNELSNEILKIKKEIEIEKTKTIYNQIKIIYSDTKGWFLFQPILKNKMKALELLLEIIYNKNDNEIKTIFNKYIIKFKSEYINSYYIGMGTFDNIEIFLLKLNKSINSPVYDELYNYFLKIKDLISKEK